jgi:hypothetical protein
VRLHDKKLEKNKGNSSDKDLHHSRTTVQPATKYASLPYLDANEETILAESPSAFIDPQVANNPDTRRRYEAPRRRGGK